MLRSVLHVQRTVSSNANRMKHEEAETRISKLLGSLALSDHSQNVAVCMRAKKIFAHT